MGEVSWGRVFFKRNRRQAATLRRRHARGISSRRGDSVSFDLNPVGLRSAGLPGTSFTVATGQQMACMQSCAADW
jgi:hypothetical protein